MNKKAQVKTEANLQEELTSLTFPGANLESPELRERFAGVLENIMREISSGMCTVEQGVAYLENFELHLLTEQWSAQQRQAA